MCTDQSGGSTSPDTHITPLPFAYRRTLSMAGHGSINAREPDAMLCAKKRKDTPLLECDLTLNSKFVVLWSDHRLPAVERSRAAGLFAVMVSPAGVTVPLGAGVV